MAAGKPPPAKGKGKKPPFPGAAMPKGSPAQAPAQDQGQAKAAKAAAKTPGKKKPPAKGK